MHIVACTGFHLRRYYPADAEIWQSSAGEAYAAFMDEVQFGLVETRSRISRFIPAFSKLLRKPPCTIHQMQLFQAVAAACRSTGLAIEMHTEKGSDAESFLAFFLDQGVSPERLVFCHMDKRPDFGLHRELAFRGVMLEYDTFVRPKYNPEENVWPLLQKMVEEGLTDRVALATDMALTNMWQRLGGAPGPIAFLSQIKAQLKRIGFEPDSVRRLMGGNIAARLAAAPTPATRKDHEQLTVYL